MTETPEIDALQCQQSLDWTATQAQANSMETAKFLLNNAVSELYQVKQQLKQAQHQQSEQALETAVKRLKAICNYCRMPRLNELTGLEASNKTLSLKSQWINTLEQEINAVFAAYRGVIDHDKL